MLPIPVGDENPTARRPLVNTGLIALNALVFLALNVARGEGFFELTLEDSRRWGLLPGDPQPLRFLSCLFVHAGPWHLLGNMWFLHIFGDNVEDKLGRAGYLLLYLGWGVAASLAFLLLGGPGGEVAGHTPEEVEAAWRTLPLVGASGAIAGVMGAYLVFFPRARIRMVWWLLVFLIPFSLPSLVVIGMYFVQDLLLGALQQGGTGGVAYAAHTGGMLAGIAAALALKPFLRGGPHTAWDRDTGFAPGGAAAEVAFDPRRPEPPRTIPMPDLRDQLVGAVLDGRMDLALELYGRWIGEPRLEVLPPHVEIEVAHEILRRGRVAEAMEAYRRFLGSHPRAAEAPEAKFRVGLIYAKAEGDAAEARRWLRQAAEEHPDPATREFVRKELLRLEG
ncbi:MAG: rhomboid family intramembrane serine protease [Planctomycetes bacterium]|nr:rhomboid family intramembrane serine protease [Planctomycetota bacterium]